MKINRNMLVGMIRESIKKHLLSERYWLRPDGYQIGSATFRPDLYELVEFNLISNEAVQNLANMFYDGNTEEMWNDEYSRLEQFVPQGFFDSEFNITCKYAVYDGTESDGYATSSDRIDGTFNDGGAEEAIKQIQHEGLRDIIQSAYENLCNDDNMWKFQDYDPRWDD